MKTQKLKEVQQLAYGCTSRITWIILKPQFYFFNACFLLLLLLYNNTFSYQADLLRVSATSTSPPAHLDISSTLWHPSPPELLYYP